MTGNIGTNRLKIYQDYSHLTNISFFFLFNTEVKI